MYAAGIGRVVCCSGVGSVFLYYVNLTMTTNKREHQHLYPDTAEVSTETCT
jgi:hypothetical protein